MKLVKQLKYSLIFSILLLYSCGSDDEPTVITDADVENAFQQFEIRPGTQDLTLQITETINYDFRVIFPDVDLNQELPLIFALHWDANGSTTVHMETDCYVEPGLQDLDAIIISPNGGQTVWGTGENQDKIRILYTLAARYWPVDVNKIALIGYSSGGNGTWFFNEHQPHIFSAGIAIASGYNILSQDGTPRTIANPLYVIHGEEDDFFPIDTVSYWIEQTVQAGSDIEFVIAPELGHYEPCNYVPYIKTAAIWLRDDIWN